MDEIFSQKWNIFVGLSRKILEKKRVGNVKKWMEFYKRLAGLNAMEGFFKIDINNTFEEYWKV